MVRGRIRWACWALAHALAPAAAPPSRQRCGRGQGQGGNGDGGRGGAFRAGRQLSLCVTAATLHLLCSLLPAATPHTPTPAATTTTAPQAMLAEHAGSGGQATSLPCDALLRLCALLAAIFAGVMAHRLALQSVAA